MALAVVVSHVLSVKFLHNTPAGSLVGNLLQNIACFLAVVMAFHAARRTAGFSRSFWTLVAFGMGMWGIANIGWAYYELVLRYEPPPGSMIRFLFDTQGMLFVMAVFLNQEKSDSRVEAEEALDFIQIGILFFLIYFGMYYLPALNLDPRAALQRELWVVMWGDAGIILLAALQWKRGRSPEARKLYGGLALFQMVYTIGALVAENFQMIEETPTGNWFDLGWTIPLLYGAFWAASWEAQPRSSSFQTRKPKSLAGIVVTNGMFAFVPLAILFLVAELGPGWKLLRFSLLLVSFLCYALRIGLSQFQQRKDEETVRRQTLAMDSSVDGIALIDEKGLHVYANSAFAEMLGFEGPEAIVGKPWRVVYAFQEMDRLEPEIRRSLAQNHKWTSSLPLKRPNGSKLSVELTITAMPDGGTVCVCRDLSEREKAERARVEAEAKYRTLVEQVNAITYIAELGIDGLWYYVSPQVESILGYTPDEWLAVSRNWASFIHPDDVEMVEKAEEASLKGEPFQAEFRVRRKDGREVWLNDTAVVVKGSDAHPVMEGIIVDITERKQLETQLQQSRKMEAVGRLAGGIAHDFNNLLTIITGYTDLALSRPSVPLELRSDIERIENAAGRAAALVRQLLAFSRKQVLQPKTLDLNAIVENMDKLLRRLIDDNIEMSTRVRGELGRVKADPAQIEQVIMNLVVNARDAMPEGGKLLLETSNVNLDAAYAFEHASVKPGPYVMLAVSDTGVGMNEVTVAHIFEPFYTTKESGRGTGLGLSTVYGIVKQSGGYIWVYSEPGKGSTFKVYLPRVEEMAEESAPAKVLYGEQRGSETVLLVEDEEAVRDLVRTILTGQGYEVIVAREPGHAEEIARKFPREIQLLLTDVVMPGTSGRELAARIMASRPGIHVLYMSGYTENVVTSGGMLEEGLAFLQKPFSPAVLAQKVREVLTHAPTS
jgi:two-component system cell cycle sensor histidine kinase/response regulator CckA